MKNLNGFLLGALLVFYSAIPVFADDTEIFLGAGTVAGGVQPNVLFILDNSGSMNSGLDDGSGLSRLEAMKEAFAEIMATTNGVNIGLMRFNTPGGSIMLPVQDIDKEIPTEPYIVVPSMLSGHDDAVELHDDVGTVLVDESSYNLSHVETNEAVPVIVASMVASASASGSGSGIGNGIEIATNIVVTSTTVNKSDDAEEFLSTGIVSDCCREWNIRSTQINGVRFPDVNVPKGALITSAKITLTARGNSGSATTLWTGEDSSDALPFVFGSYFGISGRPRVQSSGSDLEVEWQMQAWNSLSTYDSPDLSAIVQELVNRPDWQANNAMAFIQEFVSGSHKKSFLLNPNYDPRNPAELQITYSTSDGDRDDDPSAAPTQQTVGLRFENIDIPKGATVTSAQINFTAAETDSSLSTYDVQIQRSGNAQPFNATPGNLRDSLTRPKFPAAPLQWTVDDTWTEDFPESGPDVTSLVQEVVSNVGDWCANNAMAFFITAGTPQGRKALSFDHGLGQQPQLSVSYTYDESSVAPADVCRNEFVVGRVTTKENDAEEQTNTSVTNNSSDLDLKSGEPVGIRFSDLPIAQGATILSAHLALTASDNDANPTTVRIDAHAHDDSPAFPRVNRNITDRTTTPAGIRVDWNINNDWAKNVVYTSDDLAPLIQAVVSRGGWLPGNALSLILLTKSGDPDREAFSFDGSSADAPRLIIKVANGGTSMEGNTVRQHANSLVQNLDGRGYTPIVDSLYEASLYFRGSPVHYGISRQRFEPIQDNSPKSSKRVSVIESHSATAADHIIPAGCDLDQPGSNACSEERFTGSPSYISPITSDCQSSHIVLLTDGAPNNNHSAKASEHPDGVALIPTLIGSGCSGNGSQECAKELAGFLATTDQQPSFPAAKNTIKTHTIAFDLNSTSATNFLTDIATAGEGGFYTASTASQLANTFQSIIQGIVTKDTTFVSPGATVNQFNRLSHRNEIYFSLFKPDNKPKWSGNLKRYKLLGSPPVIVDANDVAAVDETTGFFKPTAKSVWSTSVDGSNVASGGAANELPNPNNRKVYTHLSKITPPSNNLNSPINRLNETNLAIDQSMLGLADPSKRTNILKWARGVDVKDFDGDGNTNETRFEMGDPLHSVPALVTYGGTDENPDITLFVATNEGFLHAIDGADGSEHFSFIPEELLGNLEEFYDNTKLFSKTRYGLDGSPVVWVNDVDGDVIVNGGDHVYLYVGMRRGGRNYYALDVTTRSNPKALWTIKGGIAGDDFETLGQTWSTPTRTKIKIGTNEKHVLIFGGGYNPDEDDNLNRLESVSGMGNAIFIVDAETGERLWWSSPTAVPSEGLNLPGMTYPIPSDIAVADMDSDGFADQLYVADLGGQVWRMDINNGENNPASLVTGGVIADLGSDTDVDYAKFFYKPSVSLLAKDGRLVLGVGIGSGNRPRPAADRTTENKMHMLFQYNVFNPPGSYTKVTRNDLTNRTQLFDAAPISAEGWYIDLAHIGEKSLSSPITVDGKLYFTTFEPNAAPNACTAVAGSGHLYVVQAINGNAALDLNDDGVLDVTDVQKSLGSGAIPPTPKLLFPKDSTPLLLIGPEQFNPGLAAPDWEPIYWQEDID